MAWKTYKQYDTSKGFGNAREWKKAFKQTMTEDEAESIIEAQEQSPCDILGVSVTATRAEIKKAFRALIMKWHPDLNKDNELEATEMSKKIIAAYTLLTK